MKSHPSDVGNLYVNIQANETIAVDDCLYLIGKTGEYCVVGKAVCTGTNTLPFIGFATTALVLNERGKMLISGYHTGIGTTNYVIGETIVVGDNSKPSWLLESNYPVAGEHKQIIGIGGGVGAIFINNTIDAVSL